MNPRMRANPNTADIVNHFVKLRARWRGKAVALSSAPLTAALCYDCVVLPWRNFSQKDIRKTLDYFQYGLRIGPDDDAILQGYRLGKDAESLLEVVQIDLPPSQNLRQQAAYLRKLTGAKVIPVFATAAEQAHTFKTGNRKVIVGTLANIRIVDERRASFSQILEFRRDVEAARKYRRMLRWLDLEMVGKSGAELADVIAQKLDDYEWSLRKHGIKTVTGVVSETLDGKYLLGTSGIAAGLAATGHPALGAIAGAGLAVGRLIVKAVGGLVDWKDAERGLNSEIAWVYEAKRRL